MTNRGIWEDIKWKYRYGGDITRLILINIAVFVAVNIAVVITFLFTGDFHFLDKYILYLSVPADLRTLGRQPWSIVTSMFLHQGIWHILINMLWLYWFGVIFKDFLGESRIVPVYIMGGLFGALIFILAFNIFPALDPTHAFALGASAAVMAIVIAAAATVPDFSVHLIFLGPVKLKWIALFVVVMDLVSIPTSNTGGHIAHLGGSLFGLIYAMQFRNGNDWSKGYYVIWDGLKNFFDFSSRKRSGGRSRSKVRMAHKNETAARTTANGGAATPREKVPSDKQAKIDEILDKISRSGYESLSKEEKEFLFKMSKE